MAEKKSINYAALATAVVALLSAVTAYVKARTEPQAQGAYEALVVELVKAREAVDKNHEDLEKLRSYLDDQNKLQDERMKSFADAIDSATKPPGAAPTSSPGEQHKTGMKRARAAVTRPPAPPPTIQAPPPAVDKAKLDRAFRDRSAEHAGAL